MNNIDEPFDRATRIEREGAAWVALMVTGHATKADLSALAQWRGQSPAHRQALAAAVKVHRLVGLHEETKNDGFMPSFLERASTRRAAMLGAIGLGFGGYAAVKPPFGLWSSYAELASDYHTGAGERRQIALAQGVSVQLNTRSAVSLRSGSRGPGIDLVGGEIAVSAKPDLAKSFSVYAGKTNVLARSAAFTLRYDASGTCVTCLEGHIAIAGAAGRLALAPRQQVQVSDTGFGRPATIDPYLVTAWQRGLIIFHDANLDTVIAEINRYRQGRVVITNANLARSRFSGEFRISRLDDAVQQIAHVANASATYLPGGVVVLA